MAPALPTSPELRRAARAIPEGWSWAPIPLGSTDLPLQVTLTLAGSGVVRREGMTPRRLRRIRQREEGATTRRSALQVAARLGAR